MARTVKMLGNADEAAAMLRMAAQWLQDNAPEVLRATLRATEHAKDAERYRWLKSRKGLDLRTENDHSVWTRLDGSKFNATHYLVQGGTQHAPADGLDATVDAAMLAANIRAA